ncbi:hypothetical protein [Cohnella phaseoli]|uniref:Carbohydrate binding protein n=1 Tax=Cohnella phaseoli TaxID=456490 RepID=A0A3D9JSY9_9BACL|nr:hypothetical protein [Cohnella phaseoli]RED76899.1 hypothetical protein DFP98_110120 [Cohnella phaseoli]
MAKRKKFISIVIVALISGTLQGLLTQPEKALASDSDAIKITVNNSVKAVIAEGIGWNAENIWSGENKIDGEVIWSTSEWNRYNNIVKFLKPQIIRYGAALPQWSPSYGTYDFDTNWMKNHYKQLDAFQAMGANVIWANWWAASQSPDNFWWSEVTRNGGTDPDSTEFNDHPYDTAKFAEAVAHAISYLRNTKNYTNIKYVSLWNEPDWNYVSPTARYPEDATTGTNSFWPMYAETAAALTNAGVRDDVGIVGPETSWIERFGNNTKTYVLDPVPGTQRFGQVVDQVAFHDYEDWFDYDTRTFDDSRNYNKLSTVLDTIKDIRSSVESTYNSKGKTAPPFFLTEVANTGYGAAYVEDASAVVDGGLYSAEMTVRALSEGVDGIMRWNLTSTTQATLPFNTVFRPIIYDPSDSNFKINGASYYSGAVLSRYLTRGSNVYDFSVSGAGSQPRVFTAPLKGTDGLWTIYLVNDDFEEKQVDLDLSSLGIADGTIFHEFQWSASNPEGIHANQALAYRGRDLNIPLLPRSVMALTMRGADEFTPNSMLTVNQETGGITTTTIVNPIDNGGFEDGSATGWTTSGNVTIDHTPLWSNTGDYLVSLNTAFVDSEITQTVSGLSPGNYLLRAHVRTSGSNSAYVGVKNFDGFKDYSQEVKSADYRTASVTFTIPAGVSSATIYLKGAHMTGTWVNADDFEIVRTPTLLNGSFEGEVPEHWVGSGSVTREATSTAHSGEHVATINSWNGGGSFSQTLAGLLPGRYSFTGYVRAGGGAAGSIRASGFGGPDVSVSTSNTYWTRLKIDFTIPSGMSSATLSFESAAAGSGAFSNGDDFELRPSDGINVRFDIDSLDNDTKIFSRSSNLFLDTTNTSFFSGDWSRLTRTTNLQEQLIYHLAGGINRFVAWGWSWPGEATLNFTFYTSPDNVVYTAFTPASEVTAGGTFNWDKIVYDSRALPAGTKYLKIVFPLSSTYSWNPQLGFVTLYD